MSFLTKIRKVIHTTPVLRQVSQGFANSFGMSKAYSEFDEKIGYSESGEPVPADTGNFSTGFGREDLAAYMTERNPQMALMLEHYRAYDRATGRVRRQPMPVALPAEEDDLDLAPDEDYPDEEEE